MKKIRLVLALITLIVFSCEKEVILPTEVEKNQGKTNSPTGGKTNDNGGSDYNQDTIIIDSVLIEILDNLKLK